MIYSLKGTLVHTEQNLAVVECGGVGYGCRTTLNTLKDLKLNTEVKLYTYMSVREDAVSSGDFKTITQANGIGPKMAQRIVLELKDKFKSIEFEGNAETSDGIAVKAPTGNIPAAVQALAVLGFSSAEVTPILTKLDPSLSVEQMIGATLKKLGR